MTGIARQRLVRRIQRDVGIGGMIELRAGPTHRCMALRALYTQLGTI